MDTEGKEEQERKWIWVVGYAAEHIHISRKARCFSRGFKLSRSRNLRTYLETKNFCNSLRKMGGEMQSRELMRPHLCTPPPKNPLSQFSPRTCFPDTYAFSFFHLGIIGHECNPVTDSITVACSISPTAHLGLPHHSIMPSILNISFHSTSPRKSA